MEAPTGAQVFTTDVLTTDVPASISMMVSSPKEYVAVAKAAIVNAQMGEGVLSVLQHISKHVDELQDARKVSVLKLSALCRMLQDDEFVLAYLSLSPEEQGHVKLAWEIHPHRIAPYQHAADVSHGGDVCRYAIDALDAHRPFVVMLDEICFTDVEQCFTDVEQTFVWASGAGLGAQDRFDQVFVPNDVGALVAEVAEFYGVRAETLRVISPAGQIYQLGQQLIPYPS